jgi:hypothetical protein
MSDDLERRLDEFYRGLDESGRRVEARWKTRVRTRPMSALPWAIAGGIAAAAALLVVLSLQRTESTPPTPALDLAKPSALPNPPSRPIAPPPEPTRRQEPRIELPAPAPRPDVKPPETPAPPTEPRKTEPPKPAPAAPPEEPKRPEPKPTVVERAVATIREAEGVFELGEKTLRGKQKDFVVAAGDRLRAASVVRLTLADDRFILLSPKSVVEFRPEEKKLSFAIDVGDLHAELIGPGPEVRVATRTCEIQPLGTVFTVRAEEKRTSVTVERGRVEVRGSKGKSAVRAGESALAMEDGTVSVPFAADLRTLAWTRSHRPAESTLFFEEFNKPGAWKAEVDKGVARAVATPGGGATLELVAEKPIFEVPVRGQIQIVCRSDRASKMYLQYFVRELRVNFRKEVPILKGPAWKAIAFDFDEMVSVDKTKHAGRAPAGSLVYDFGLVYGEEGEKGNFWVDSIKIVEVRP